METLSKAKLLPHGGISVDYTIAQAVGDESLIIERSERSDADIHPDLRMAFDSLAKAVAGIFGLPDAGKIEVRGIALSGSGEKAAVVVTSVYETTTGQKCCINTPKVLLNNETFGDALSAGVDAIKAEVHALLFEGKSAQLSIFGKE